MYSHETAIKALQEHDKKEYTTIAYSYVTASTRHSTLNGAREYAKDIEGENLSHEEIDPQDNYPVTEVKIFDDDGNEVV